jgi:hypothetical protein
MFKREKEMRPIVTKWLENHGYYVAYEVLVGDCWCDIVGCKWAKRTGRKIPALLEAIAVELKLDNIANVLYEAQGNMRHGGVTQSYAAMPAERIVRMQQKTVRSFEDAGCGLVMVSPDRVEIIIEASQQSDVDKNLACRLWSYKLRADRASKINQVEKPK